MTISFHCPFCTAAIQVDDSAAGKPGRCPMCASQVKVPRPAPAEAPPQPEPVPVAEVPAEPLPAVGEYVPAESPFVDPRFSQPLSQPGLLPDPTRSSPLPASAVARKVQRRARRRRGLWIPVLFIGIFVAVIAALTGPSIDWASFTGDLSGELTGSSLDDLDREPTRLSCKGAALPSRQVQGILEHFVKEPVVLSGSLMNAQVRGSEDGLLLSVRSGRETGWYRVDPNSNPRFAKYLIEQFEALETRRAADVKQALDDFLAVAVRVQGRQAPTDDYSPFRDRLLVPGMVRGLGYHVAALVGRELYPCVVESKEGQLYFLLPRNTQQFTIVGKKLPNGSTPFPGKFVVNVEARTARDRVTIEALPTPEPEPAMSNEPSPDSEQ